MVSVAPQTGMAWDYGKNRYAHRYVSLSLGRHILGITYANRPEDRERVEKEYRTLLDGIRQRPLFDVPHEPGVCLPYAFIRDDGTTRRHIGMTYRLREHPDVTIWLEDANATADGPHVRSETLTARYRAKFFWEQDYKNAKRVASEWTPGYRRTEIDGREAVETFVKLVRYEDNIEDYGYLAVVRGDPDAAEDSPDLMLYVIRDAANATKRGIAPIGRDELLEMARTIAASVRKRPVQ